MTEQDVKDKIISNIKNRNAIDPLILDHIIPELALAIHYAYGAGFDAHTFSASNKVPVVKTDKEGNILKFYDSVFKAWNKESIGHNSINKSIRNHKPDSHGYYWRYPTKEEIEEHII